MNYWIPAYAGMTSSVVYGRVLSKQLHSATLIVNGLPRKNVHTILSPDNCTATRKGSYFPLNSGLRFSINALTASSWSSVL